MWEGVGVLTNAQGQYVLSCGISKVLLIDILCRGELNATVK